jgi:ribosome-binding factor A
VAGERRVRAERAYAQAFAEVLGELKTPLPALCTVVRVDMSPDLRAARVHLSLYGERSAQTASGRLLARARSFLQSEVGRRVGLRFTPSLTIVPDHSIAESVRLGQLMSGERGESGDANGRSGRGGGPPAR